MHVGPVSHVPCVQLVIRYDCFVFIDHTRAVHWLPHDVNHDDLPETYPFAE